MGGSGSRLHDFCTPKSPQLQGADTAGSATAGSATSYGTRPLRQSMRTLTQTPKQLYEASSINSQPSDSNNYDWALEAMLREESLDDHSDEPTVPNYLANSPKDNAARTAYAQALGCSFPRHVYPPGALSSSDVAASASATNGGSMSPVTVTYQHPSIESLDDSDDDTVGVGDRNTPLSTESTVPMPSISSRKASKTLEELLREQAAFYAPTDRACTSPDVSTGSVTVDPQNTNTNASENRANIGSIATDVREVKEILAMMLNDRSEKTAGPRTDEVPGLLNQVVEELRRLNGASNSLAEVLHKKLPSPPESATDFLVKGSVSDSDQKGSLDHTISSPKQPAFQPGNAQKSPKVARCFPRHFGLGVGGLTTGGHPSEQQPSENATCRMANHETKSCLIISDEEDSDVEVPKTKMAKALEKKDAEIARNQTTIVCKDRELAKKDHELATKDVEILELNQAIRRKDSMVESYMTLFAQKNEGTFKGLGSSDSEIMDFINGDEGLRGLISRRMEAAQHLKTAQRIAEASKSRPDVTVRKSGAKPRSGPEVIGDDTLTFGGGLVARPFADKGQPLSGSTPMNHNLDSKAGAGGFGAESKTVSFPSWGSPVRMAGFKPNGVLPSRFEGFPSVCRNDPHPSLFMNPYPENFRVGGHHGLRSSVTKGTGSVNTNPMGGAFDVISAPSASGKIGRDPPQRENQPTSSEGFGSPFARDPFSGYLGTTETSAVPGAFPTDASRKTKDPFRGFGEGFGGSDTS